MDELRALTAELRAVNGQLEIVTAGLATAENRANRQSLLTRLLAGTLALSVVLNGAFFVYAMNERARICAAMRSGFDTYTDALVASGGERSESEQAELDKREAAFRADLERRLAECS